MSLKFSKISPMPKHIIHKYCDKIPTALLRLWEEDGLGYLLNGYLQIINPDDYVEFIQSTYFRGDNSIPIFVTAFGDVIIYTQNGFIDIIYYRKNDFEVVGKKISHFLNFINDEEFQLDYFEIDLYQEAINMVN